MENSKNLIRALFLVAATVLMVSSATAENDDDISILIELVGCEDAGGTSYPQPDGSTITACCTPDECYVCDQDGDNCEIAKSAGGISKPAANTGTMVEWPGTKPTVGTHTKPIVRESIMQKLKRN